MPKVTSGLELELDAASPGGDAQKWANNEATPESGVAQTAYDFFRGSSSSSESSDPTLTTTSPESGSYFSFDGGDFFNLVASAGSMSSFLKNMHKAGQKWTIEAWLQHSGNTGGNSNPIFTNGASDQSGGDMSRGVIFQDFGSLGSGLKMNFRVKQNSGGATAFSKASDANIPSGSVQMCALSYDATGTDPSFFFRNGTYEPSGSANTWTVSLTSPSSSDAANSAKIGARGDTAFLVPNGTRLYLFRIYNRNLSFTELQQNWNNDANRYGYSFVAGEVRDSTNTPVQRTIRAYRRDTGALIGSTTSDATTGQYQLTLGYSGEVQLVCMDDDAGSLENDLIHRTFPV